MFAACFPFSAASFGVSRRQLEMFISCQLPCSSHRREMLPFENNWIIYSAELCAQTFKAFVRQVGADGWRWRGVNSSVGIFNRSSPELNHWKAPLKDIYTWTISNWNNFRNLGFVSSVVASWLDSGSSGSWFKPCSGSELRWVLSPDT